MAGISRDQTEAAIMTPPAKPKNNLRTSADISLRKKNTTAAPSAVIKNVPPVPRSANKTGFKSVIKTSVIFAQSKFDYKNSLLNLHLYYETYFYIYHM
jgi:hypothetical protein